MKNRREVRNRNKTKDKMSEYREMLAEGSRREQDAQIKINEETEKNQGQADERGNIEEKC